MINKLTIEELKKLLQLSSKESLFLFDGDYYYHGLLLVVRAIIKLMVWPWTVP